MERFRGGYPASIDAKGRLKLPARLREQLDGAYGKELFVCSLFPWELRLFPLRVWERWEAQIDARSPFDPLAMKFLELANYGQLVEVDDQGRVLIPQLLREAVPLEGEVVVSGRFDHLAVTSRSRATELLGQQTLSREELQELARTGR